MAKRNFHPVLTIIFCVIGMAVSLGDVSAYSCRQNVSPQGIGWESQAEIKDIYKSIFDLKFSEAKRKIKNYHFSGSEALLVFHMENLMEFIALFLNEDPKEFQGYEGHLEERLAHLEASDSGHPYHLYLQAEIELQWGLVYLKFGKYYKSFRLVKAAYKKLQTNSLKFPDFVANKKSMGILHALFGTIPEEYRWGASLLTGMEGSISQGQAELEEVLAYAGREDFLFEEEAIAMYALLQVYIKNQPARALQVMHDKKLQPSAQPLACFFYANIAMKQGRMQEALEILKNRPRGSEYHPFPYLKYMLGHAKLYNLDPHANRDLEDFLSEYPGANYRKDAYLKLAWHALIFEGEKEYQEYLDIIPHVGIALTDEDKAAEREATSSRRQNSVLLKARLAYDGGKYAEGMKILNGIHLQNLETWYHLEYKYRKARCKEALGHLNEALALYKEVITEGREDPRYYACASALYLGELYENDGNFKDARTSYSLCLQIDPDEYRSSLHQKAKTGLQRIVER